MSTTKPATGWTRDFPKVDGDYLCRINEHDLSPVSFRLENGAIYEYGCGKNLRSDYYHHATDYEFLGPLTPADFQQLAALREASEGMLALKWLRDLCLNHRASCIAITLYDNQCSCGLKDYLATDTALRNALGLQGGGSDG